MKKVQENTSKIIINAIINMPVGTIFTSSDLELPYVINRGTIRSVLARIVNNQQLTRIRSGHYKRTIGYEQYLFVYGSMKKGFQNHERLKNAEYIGDFETSGRYVMYADTSKMFPYVVEDEKRFRIQGELYKVVSKKDFEAIDLLEGVPDFYSRKQTSLVEIEGNRQFSAWIYFRSLNNPRRLVRTNPIRNWGDMPSRDERVKIVKKAFSPRVKSLLKPRVASKQRSHRGVVHLSKVNKGTVVSFESFDEISFL
ncbi:MAG: gamma-glutamylcyclotransferase family protein [Campylobacterota bacterium]|nr:gamma-glutamylcyclotransferase family protein [Campylobacterota bacterium]